MADLDIVAAVDQLQRQLADLRAHLERICGRNKRSVKVRRKRVKVANSLQTPPGPKPTALDVARAKKLLKAKGRHHYG